MEPIRKAGGKVRPKQPVQGQEIVHPDMSWVGVSGGYELAETLSEFLTL
jgi:hypothetical protein